jgi:hypothetical protein
MAFVLGFNGFTDDGPGKKKDVRSEMRPQLGFNPHEDLSRGSPTSGLGSDQRIMLEIKPYLPVGSG